MADFLSSWQSDHLVKWSLDHVVAPLLQHGWQSEIETVEIDGLYVVVIAHQNGLERRAILYKDVDAARAHPTSFTVPVDAVLFQGDILNNDLDESAPDGEPQPDYDFFRIVGEWNRACWPGRIAPDMDIFLNTYDDESVDSRGILKSENPNAAVWLRLGRLQSVTLAAKVIAAQSLSSGISLEAEVVRKKSEGVAFALRNATDYFKASDAGNLSQRILNLYYGSMSFATAEMIAKPQGPVELAEIEKVTKQGHGLYTVDDESEDFKSTIVGVLAQGFFTAWMRASGVSIDHAPAQRPRSHEGLGVANRESYVTLEGLFARIPEVSDLYLELFDGPSWWVRPVYIDEWNSWGNTPKQKDRKRTYGVVVDESGRLSKAEVASFPFPISELRQIKSHTESKVYRAAFDHDGVAIWHRALPIHRSPLGQNALIMPTFGSVGDYRAICFVILYALSIIVRYRPSLWRRLQEGDLDHMRALIETFLVAVERLLPQHFLGAITGQKILAGQPGSFR